jgi:CheY-like chemotaxis protein/two-component sensor histidine kinase
VVIDAIRDDAGKIIGFAKITRDITERRNAQVALSKVERQLAESQKLDAIGKLTGGIAHDFNNLLMIVSGHLHTIKRSVGDDPKLQRATQAIDLAAQRGAALTSQLLTFARRQRVNPESVDVSGRISAIREVLNSGLGSSANLLIDVPPNIWPVTIDTSEFEMALLNLVINARDAMPQGGTVVIGAKNETRSGMDFVIVSVTDSGVGIAPDVLNKIFDPFFTTKPVGKGTGLGLSQVHGFVHQAGGSIDVTSRVGEGTTISLSFPRSARSTDDAHDDIRIEAANGIGTVLLVEDNPDVANVSTELLRQLGYAVRWAPDARSALHELERNDIDLVFSDIVMPGGMDGLSLAQAIRQNHPKLPVVLTTGYSETAGTAGSGFPILQKPYQIHELSHILSEARR